VFDAFHQPEFNGFRNRLVKALEGPAADSMLRRLDEDQAKQAKQAIARAPIDGHIRETLERALELRFPSLEEKKDLHFYATVESIEARRKEMKGLIEVEIPANRKAIEEARELGDLRENFEYKSARQRHEYLNARVEGLHRDLERVRPFDQSKANTDEIRIGSSFVLRNRDAKELSLTIMGPWESDPDQGVISYASDLGQNLLGLKIGDSIDLEDECYEISTIGL
jgi:transcription elongation GreA/GreB family factor